MSSVPKSATVIGAGLSGLTAAYRLQKAGFQVTVLEKRANVGGRTESIHKDDFIMDTGALALTGGDDNYLSLAKEVGLEKRVVHSATAVSIVRDGRLHTIDGGKPLAALFNPVFSWGEKLQIGRGIFKLRKGLKALKGTRLTALTALDDRQSNALEMSERTFGKAITDNLIEPAIRVFAGNFVDQVSTLCLYNTLGNLANPLINMEGGIDSLPKKLAEQLNVICGAEVTKIEENAGNVTVTYRHNSQQETRESDVCVLSCLLSDAREIYPRINEIGGELMEKNHYGSVPVVSLAYNAKPKSDACIILVPLSENQDIMVIFQDQHKAPDRAPVGCSLFSVCIAPKAAEEFGSLSDAEATLRIQQYIESLYPELSGHLIFSNVAPWPKAGPKAWPGYYHAVSDFLSKTQPSDRVQLAGDFIGGSQEDAVTRGNEVANNIIANHSST
jgi:protoporphyrinogen/coproporphyrinogen III oxidase